MDEQFCQWKRVVGSEESGMYYSSCGEVKLLEGVPVGLQSCPNCRKPIKVTVEMRVQPTERYLLFAGERYYPGGGWKDFKMSFPSVQLAVKAVKGLDDYDWWQVVDSETRAIVESEDVSK